jgi:erythritol transport system ATP-binding protein
MMEMANTSDSVGPAVAPSQAAAPDVILRVQQVTKVFPGTLALDRVDFNVYRGKVNVLVGENGAGKSTLMKILAGVETATDGTLLLEGQEFKFRTPLEAAQHGIGIIFQELHLFPNLSVIENIFLARELTTYGGLIVDARAQEKRARELLEQLEQPIDPKAMVSDLRLGEQQIVEIAKALAQDVRILIMDEPTSALSAAEVTVLFRIIRDLKARGVSIIYISHKLEELLQIGDYLTVLRDGRVQAEAPVSAVDVPWIIEKMVGRNLATFFHRQNHAVRDELLRVDKLCLPQPGGRLAVDNVTFSLREGEILGIYGLMGAGRTELFECLMGLRPESYGDIYLAGKQVKAPTIAERIDLGLALIPEDRQRESLIPTLSVASNMTLASLRKYTRGFYLQSHVEKASVAQMIKDLAIKVTNPQNLIASLSGGNQQKVVVGKGLLTAPKVLLMDEPTRGIDVAAKADMFEIMSNLASQGFGVLFTSSELKEVMAMADRILVMSKGQITGEFERADATEEALVAASAVGHGPVHIGGPDDAD